MTRVVAVVLLAFVVFTCGDPVNVEKREPGDLGLSAPGLLGKDGLPNLQDLALKQLIKTVRDLIVQIRKAIEKINICPHKNGGYKDSGYGHYEPGYKDSGHGHYEPGYKPVYEPGYEPGYVPSYEPGYVPDYKPSYEPGYAPDYKPSYEPDYLPSPQYKRDANFDLACDFLKPILESIVKFLKALEKLLGCLEDKEKGDKGDYKDCQDEYKKAYPHGYAGY